MSIRTLTRYFLDLPLGNLPHSLTDQFSVFWSQHFPTHPSLSIVLSPCILRPPGYPPTRPLKHLPPQSLCFISQNGQIRLSRFISWLHILGTAAKIITLRSCSSTSCQLNAWRAWPATFLSSGWPPQSSCLQVLQTYLVNRFLFCSFSLHPPAEFFSLRSRQLREEGVPSVNVGLQVLQGIQVNTRSPGLGSPSEAWLLSGQRI